MTQDMSAIATRSKADLAEVFLALLLVVEDVDHARLTRDVIDSAYEAGVFTRFIRDVEGAVMFTVIFEQLYATDDDVKLVFDSATLEALEDDGDRTPRGAIILALGALDRAGFRGSISFPLGGAFTSLCGLRELIRRRHFPCPADVDRSVRGGSPLMRPPAPR